MRLLLAQQTNGWSHISVLKNKIVGIQVARAIAVILVLLTHAIGHPYPSAPGFVQLLGREGVTVFFVVSGYIMARMCTKGSFEPLHFIRRRFLRVVPIYYLVTAAMIVIVIVMPRALKDTTFDLQHILFSLAFLPTFSPGPEHSITPFLKLGWTLNYELFFYLCFSVLYMCTASSRALILLLVFGGLTVYGFFVPQTSAAGMFYTDPAIMGFPAGVMLATYLSEEQQRSGIWRLVALLTGGAGIIFVGMHYDTMRYAWPTQLILVFGSTCLIYVISGIRARHDDKAISTLVTIGDASYSIYLFHMFAVGIVYNIGWRILPFDYLWMLSPVAFFGGIAVGLAAYSFIEKPLLIFLGYDRPLRGRDTKLSKA